MSTFSTKYTMRSNLTLAQGYVASLFLYEYPKSFSFEQLLDAVRTGDERVRPWCIIRSTDCYGQWTDEMAEELTMHMRHAYTDLLQLFQPRPAEPIAPKYDPQSNAPRPASPEKMAQLAAFLAKR